MTDTLTHRAFVNTWECDENAHMNVQFYWKRFADASRIFAVKNGHTYAPWHDRHVRYHGELRAGTTTVVHTLGNTEGLVHCLTNGDDHSLSATAIEQFQNGNYQMEIQDTASPKSLPLAPLEPVDTKQKITDGSGFVTHLSAVIPAECDQDGHMQDQFYISRFSDAAAHLWTFLGVQRSWMHEHNLGSAAVEMKVTRHKPVVAGTLLEITSWIETIRDKTFSFCHQVADMETGEILYSGAVTALVMDLEKRKAISVPDPIAAFRQ